MLRGEQFDTAPQVKKNRLNLLPENPELANPDSAVGLGRFPSWLHRKLPTRTEMIQTSQILNNHRLHTVCEEARCPNLLECWSKKTATFLVLGKACTRSCGFCDIDFAKEPLPVEQDEPIRIAQSVKELGLRHVVITMVARDDLPDGGAAHLVAIVNTVRKEVPGVTIELLTSDLAGNFAALESVMSCHPEIFNHNIETVRSLTPRVRHKATYERTLMILEKAKGLSTHTRIKSGIMVGLGETDEEIYETLQDLKCVGCDIVTIGQYLQSNPRKLLVKSFIHPDQFKLYESWGVQLGIPHLYCGPFVRSSYNAGEVYGQL